MNLGSPNLEYLLKAGSLTSIALLFGVGGILLGGYLSDRKRPEAVAALIALINTPLLVLIGNSTGTILITITSVFAFVHFMGQPVYNSLVADYSPDNWRGRMFGISFFCLFGVGSFSGSLLGYFAERLGSHWIFWILGGFQLLVLILAIILMVKARHHRDRLMSLVVNHSYY
jgi:MFS family permease